MMALAQIVIMFILVIAGIVIAEESKANKDLLSAGFVVIVCVYVLICLTD